MKIEDWPEVNNVIFNPDTVQYIMHDPDDSRIVYMKFADGFILPFKGDEAIELWRTYSKNKGWQDMAQPSLNLETVAAIASDLTTAFYTRLQAEKLNDHEKAREEVWKTYNEFRELLRADELWEPY